jgi:ATP-dependent exoDNAse (exonuclease V) beta subunit
MIERDAGGQAIGAVILDFKTDAVTDENSMQMRAKGYAPQIKLYVQAVCRLAGLPASNVRTGLIFTSRAQICWL